LKIENEKRTSPVDSVIFSFSPLLPRIFSPCSLLFAFPLEDLTQRREVLNKRVHDFKHILNNLPVLHIFGVKNAAISFQCGSNNNSVKNLKIIFADQILSQFYRG